MFLKTQLADQHGQIIAWHRKGTRHYQWWPRWFNTVRPRQNDRHFADDTYKRIFVNENVRISIKISLKFVPKVPINNIPAMVQIMAWRRPGDKPLSEPMIVSLPTHIYVTRPQWAKDILKSLSRGHSCPFLNWIRPGHILIIVSLWQISGNLPIAKWSSEQPGNGNIFAPGHFFVAQGNQAYIINLSRPGDAYMRQ